VVSAPTGEPGSEFPSQEKPVSVQMSQAKASSAAVASTDPLEALRSSLDEAVQEALKSFHAYVAVAVSRAASASRGASSSLPDQPFPRTRQDPMGSEVAQVSLDVARKAQLDAALAAAFAEKELRPTSPAGSAAPVKVAPPPVAPPPVASVLPPPPVAPVEPPPLPPPAPVPTLIQAAPRSLPAVESPFTVVPPPELVAPGREPAAPPVFPFGKGVTAEIKEEKVPPVSASEPLPFSPFQGMAPVSSPPALDKAAGAEPGLFRPPDGEKTSPPWLPPPPAVLGFSKPPGPAFPPAAAPAVAAPVEAAAEPAAARLEVPTFGIPQSATAPFRVVAPPMAPPAAPPVTPPPVPLPVPPPPVPPVGADAPAPAAEPAAGVGFNFAELLRANGQRN
jgi:hypothetical protein